MPNSKPRRFKVLSDATNLRRKTIFISCLKNKIPVDPVEAGKEEKKRYEEELENKLFWQKLVKETEKRSQNRYRLPYYGRI